MCVRQARGGAQGAQHMPIAWDVAHNPLIESQCANDIPGKPFMLTDENGDGYRLNGTALADDAHFASGDEENQNQRLMRESDYYTLMAMQIQAYKCWIAVLAASGHYGWRDFKNEAGARVANRVDPSKEDVVIRYTTIDEALRLNGIFFTVTQQRAVHWHLLYKQIWPMVRRWATGCSKSLIVIGIVDMIAKAKVVFAMRHSLDGMVAVDALEHQAWLAVYTLMHVHRNMPRSWRWTPQTMGGLGWSRWWDVVNTRKVVMLLGFLQGELPDERTSAEAMVYREQQLWPSSVPIMEMRLSTDTSDKGVLSLQGPLTWMGQLRQWLRRYGFKLLGGKKPAWMHGQDLLLLCCTPADVKIMSRGCRVHDVWFLHQVYSYASGAFYQEYDAAAAKTMAVFESWTEANNKVHGIRHRSFPTLNTRSWRNRLHAAVARCRCQLRVYRYVENVGRACLVQGLDGT